MFELTIGRQDRQAVLNGTPRDPQIVGRDWRTLAENQGTGSGTASACPLSENPPFREPAFGILDSWLILLFDLPLWPPYANGLRRDYRKGEGKFGRMGMDARRNDFGFARR